MRMRRVVIAGLAGATVATGLSVSSPGTCGLRLGYGRKITVQGVVGLGRRQEHHSVRR